MVAEALDNTRNREENRWDEMQCVNLPIVTPGAILYGESNGNRIPCMNGFIPELSSQGLD